MSKSWYSINNKANSNTASISIHDEIGLWGISAAQFLSDLKALGAVNKINLSIHSPGGNVLDGLAMYNALDAIPAAIHGKVEGIAASAASFVLMSADTIEMPEDSFLMIHNAMGGAIGDSKTLREMADIIDKLQESIVNIYQKRTGLDKKILAEMMANETWMTAKEARDLGFADEISNAIEVAAKIGNFDKYFKAMPFDTSNKAIESIENIRDLEKHLRDSGFSRTKATEIVAKIKASCQREADNGAEKQQLADLSARLSRLNIPKSLRQD